MLKHNDEIENRIMKIIQIQIKRTTIQRWRKNVFSKTQMRLIHDGGNAVMSFTVDVLLLASPWQALSVQTTNKTT